MKKIPMNVSFFLHRWEKHSVVISLDEFINDVRGPRWKVLALAYRDFLHRGMLKEAAGIKDNLAGITAAGVCHGGHGNSQLRELSQVLMLDLDHTNERTPEILKLLQALPYVVATFVSISGQGIKILIRVAVENVQQYAAAYPIVANEVNRLAGVACDLSCRNPGRLCYGSWDEEAYYHPQADCFPWQEKMTGTLSDATSHNTVTSGACGMASADAENTSAPGFMKAFLDHFVRHNTFLPGHRHTFMLKLGRVAKYKGFSLAEMEIMKQLCLERFVESDYLDPEMEKDLLSGYHYVTPQNTPPEKPLWGHKVQGSPSVPLGPLTEEEEADEMSEKSECLRKQAPYFPDEIFDHLPDFLYQGLLQSRNKRERDLLLMGMLANISGCLPNVHILYDQIYCSSHLYFTAVAHAGAGKGVLTLASYLPDAIHEHYLLQNRQNRREYEEGLLRWDIEQKEAQQAKRIPNLDLRPEEPKKICLKVSPNLSKSQLIIYLEANAELGAIINASELDMVSNAMRQDCGKHDDVFRAAFQHEEVSSSFKVDNRQITAHEPHLAFCFSGTPTQLVSFIVSLENGMFSRISFYTAQAQSQWRSAAPRKGGSDMRSTFKELSKRLLEIHLFLLQSPTEVVLTPQQWATHSDRFGAWLTGVVSEKDDTPGAIVLRHGLMAARIACVLTALRKADCAWTMKEYACTDEDFHTAMQVTQVLLEHSLLLSTSLPGSSHKARPLQSFFRIRPVLKNLANTFTYSMYINEAVHQEVSRSTAKRLLNKMVLLKIIEKEGDMYTKTERFCC